MAQHFFVKSTHLTSKLASWYRKWSRAFPSTTRYCSATLFLSRSNLCCSFTKLVNPLTPIIKPLNKTQHWIKTETFSSCWFILKITTYRSSVDKNVSDIDKIFTLFLYNIFMIFKKLPKNYQYEQKAFIYLGEYKKKEAKLGTAIIEKINLLLVLLCTITQGKTWYDKYFVWQEC